MRRHFKLSWGATGTGFKVAFLAFLVVTTLAAWTSLGAAATVLKISSLVILAVMSLPAWKFDFAGEPRKLIKSGSYKPAILHIALNLLALASIIAVPFIGLDIVRVPLTVLFVICFMVDTTYFYVTGGTLDVATTWVLWLEREGEIDNVRLYLPYLLRSSWWLPFLGVIFILRPAAPLTISALWGLVPLLAIGLASAVVLHTKGALQHFLSPIGLPIKLAVALSTKSPAEISNLPPEVEYSADLKPIAKHIVFILDESVRGDALGFNGATPDNTPYLSSHQAKFINFGVAVAGANASVASRTMLRFGVRPEDIDAVGREGYTRPTIWQYAQRAGYRTILITSLHGDQRLYMNSREWKAIDESTRITGTPIPFRDDLIADKILQLLKSDRPCFIYANKFGVHIPYECTYPSNFNPFPRSVNGSSENTENGSEVDGDREYKDELCRNYNNAVTWSVDNFFKKVLSSNDLSDTLIIYTSDHGQSLLDGGQKLSHGATGAAQIGEGLVPMLAATNIKLLAETLRASAKLTPNQSSHFEIFPTFLIAMGFDRQWVRSHYGPSLLELPDDRPRRFLIARGAGLKGWFDDPIWVSVD